MKRVFDLAVASLLLLAVAPILAACALAVRLTSKGPAIFGHQRYGRGGTTFNCLKLRTMVAHAEAWLEEDEDLRVLHKQNDFKLPLAKDPRVTRIGRFLRVSHIDELPQLINVLRGEMSLVGPRPVVGEELEWYGDRAGDLLAARPGIFGLWTVQGHRRVEYPARVSVELEYVDNSSFVGDVSILLQHVPVLLRGQGEE